MTRKMSRKEELWVAERAIALQVLRDDHPERWTGAELEAETSDLEPGAVKEALGELATVGVLIVDADGEHVEASQCARHLDWLDLIGV